MKESPIIMSTPMMQAYLAGRKTMTRRVINPQPKQCTVKVVQSMNPRSWISRWPVDLRGLYPDSEPTTMLGDIHKCPYGGVGDKLWFRETFTWVTIAENEYCPNSEYFRRHPDGYPVVVIYKADTIPSVIKEYNWTPSIFMPKWACRAKPLITGIKVERLQSIGFSDVMAEGCPIHEDAEADYDEDGIVVGGSWFAHHRWFQNLWDSINGKKHPWESNPWCWCISFERFGENKGV